MIMMALSTKKEMMAISSSDEESNKKCCIDCKTTKTPLWRGGPAGPKSLCNACGIRYRKRRRAELALNSSSQKKTKNKERSRLTTTTPISASNGGTKLNGSLKMVSLMALGKDFYLQRLMTSSVVKKQRWQRRRKLCEEELAAVSLLALSCSSVYA